LDVVGDVPKGDIAVVNSARPTAGETAITLTRNLPLALSPGEAVVGDDGVEFVVRPYSADFPLIGQSPSLAGIIGGHGTSLHVKIDRGTSPARHDVQLVL
jgi:hypothetical protein